MTTTISKYLLNKFKEFGVQDVFGVPGDYILNLYKDMSECKDLKVITTCDEQGAGFAADSYARIKGFSVVVVTYGAGALKVVNSTAQAHSELSPVLIISGAPTRTEVSKNLMVHHRIGAFNTQLKIFEHITTASAYLTPENALHEIDRVFHHVKEYSAPGYLEIPLDLVTAPLPFTHQIPSSPPAHGFDEEAIQEALNEVQQRISSAKQPIVIVGLDVHRMHLQEQVMKWIEMNDFPFVTGLGSKAVLPESHPNFLGVYEEHKHGIRYQKSSGVMSTPEISKFVEGSDCIIKLGFYETDFNLGAVVYTVQLPTSKTVNVKREKTMIAHHTYENFGLRQFLERVVMMKFAKEGRVSKESWPQVVKQKEFRPAKDKKLTTARFFQALNTCLQERPSVIVPDTGVVGFGSAELEIPENSTYMSGFAVPAGIGAQLAKPGSKTVVLVGDGAFQMTGVEVSTAARFKLSPLIVVLNNAGYTTERIIEEGPFDDVHKWNYAKLHQVIPGITAARVTTEQELFEHLKKAYTHDTSPYLIEAVVDTMDLPAAQQRARDARK